jgi:hypothetical protein
MILKKFQVRPAALRDAAYNIEEAAGRVFPFNTAVTLRLTSSVHGTNRTVIGDSAFSSVSTARACNKYGLHFMGIIKTAHKQYPKAILKALSHGRPRGSYKLMQTTSTEHPTLYALAWADKKLKLLISTRGTTIETDPSMRKRARLNEDGTTHEYSIAVPRPSMVKMFFEPFNAVDTNDQYRQGILKLEENWKTYSWTTRAISTVLGVIFVNSHLAVQLLEGQGKSSSEKLKNDMDKLAHRLIFNPYLTDEQRDLRPRPDDQDVMTTPEGLRGNHLLARLMDSTKYRGKPRDSTRVRCSICRVPTRTYCVDCSDDSRQRYVAVCRQGSSKKGISLCYYEHKNGL